MEWMLLLDDGQMFRFDEATYTSRDRNSKERNRYSGTCFRVLACLSVSKDRQQEDRHRHPGGL
jgi:hypothetical protein